MRVSVNPEECEPRGVHAPSCDCFLDGKPVQGVIIADTELGWLRRYAPKEDGTGYKVQNDEVVVEELTGVVEVKLNRYGEKKLWLHLDIPEDEQPGMRPENRPRTGRMTEKAIKLRRLAGRIVLANPEMNPLPLDDWNLEIAQIVGSDLRPPPFYTTDWNAAFTLVPENYDWIVGNTNGHMGGTPHARVGDKNDSHACSAILSLVAACLVAQAEIEVHGPTPPA